MSDLLDFLQRNKQNKGILASLRRGLSSTTEIYAWPLLAKFKGIGNSQNARAVRTVAGLFAYHPLVCTDGNMGTTCRELCGDNEKPWECIEKDGVPTQPGPMSRKFSHLLAADVDEICDRVARIVLYAKSKEIPINYCALEEDLKKWPYAREKWASAFWAPEKKDEENKESKV